MSSLNRRRFLQATAAGLASLPAVAVKSLPSDEDPLGVRADFPITRTQAYLNSAFVGPIPTVVREAAIEYADEKMLRPTPGRRREKLEEARSRFVDLFGGKTEEVGFLYGTSEGENIIANALDLQAGDNIVLDELHFITSFVLYRHLEEEKGIELRLVPAKNGRSPVEDFETRVDRRTRLVSVAWVSNQNGYRHDLPALADLVHGKGGYLYVDAIQALGTFPTNLTEECADFLCSGGFKWLFASFGIAPFVVREEHLDRIRPDRFGHGHVVEELPDHHYRLDTTAKKFEYSALAFSAVYMLNAALGYLKKVGLSRIEQHGFALAGELRDGIAKLGFETLTPPDNPSTIVSFVHGRDADQLRRLLEEEGVVVSFRERGAQIRASVALFNNRSDVQRLLRVLEKVT